MMAEGKARPMGSEQAGEPRKGREGETEAGKEASEHEMEAGKQAMHETTKHAGEAMKQGAETTKRGIVATKRAFDREMEATMKVSEVSMDFYQDAMAFGRGNVDAIVKANMVMAHGYQEIFKAMIGMAKEAMEDGLGRSAIDKITNRSSQISEIYMSMIESAMEPISDRFAAAATTMKEGAERQRLGREPERREGQR